MRCDIPGRPFVVYVAYYNRSGSDLWSRFKYAENAVEKARYVLGRRRRGRLVVASIVIDSRDGSVWFRSSKETEKALLATTD